jgi:hypothetical protein
MTPTQPAGWYPDPTRRADQRYWDGDSWTDHVSRAGVQGTDPVAATSTQPLTGTSTQTAQRKKPKWPWVLGGILAAFLVVGAGCAVILGVAVNNAVNHLNAEQRAHAITAAQFDAVPLGASQADVIRVLGKQPEDASRFVSKGVLSQTDIRSSCIYYNRSGGGFGPGYTFCFTNGALDFKHSFG